MNVLIVYGTQFGTTEHLARVIGAAIEPTNSVQITAAERAHELTGHGIDLLIVGAPTQVFGRRLLVRSFLRGLGEQGFAGMDCAAFDTRMGTAAQGNASEAEVIADQLVDAGCRLVVPPESFFVTGFKGPMADGEEDRARTWALSIVKRRTATAV